MAALFARFGDNTVDELRKMGAFGLIGLLSAMLALIQPMTASDMSPAEKKVVARMQAEVQTLKDKLDQIQAADIAANEMYVSNLPRAALKRASPSPDYTRPISAPKRKPSAAKHEEARQETLFRHWEHLKMLALRAVREYLLSGSDRSAIPEIFQAKPDRYGRYLNNFSCDFWKT
jgi:DNA-binding protein H-NS